MFAGVTIESPEGTPSGPWLGISATPPVVERVEAPGGVGLELVGAERVGVVALGITPEVSARAVEKNGQNARTFGVSERNTMKSRRTPNRATAYLSYAVPDSRFELSRIRYLMKSI